MAKLIFTDKNHVGRVYELTLEKTTVGRSDQNILVIPDSSLSALHCEIHVNGPEVIVRDLGSRNGTYVNGVKLVDHQAQLKSGQTVRFGSVEARLELDGHSDDDSVSDITAIHAMGRIMREQKWEEEHPKPMNPSMKIESSDSNADADRTVTSMIAIKSREATGPVPSVPTAREREKSSKATALVIAAVIALGLIVLLWLWWGRK
jgi:pSer/pThr/pTyr-binding forkhead associated (FHA) protein